MLKPKSRPVTDSPKPLPILGELPVNMQLQILAAAFLLFVMVAAFVGLMDKRSDAHRNTQVAAIGQMKTIGQQLAKAGLALQLGQSDAPNELRTGRERLAGLLTALTEGSNQQPAAPAGLKPQLDDVRRHWAPMDRQIQAVLAQEKRLTAFGRFIADIQEKAGRAGELAAQAGGGAPALVERIVRNSAVVAVGQLLDEGPAVQLLKDLASAPDQAGKQAELGTILKAWQQGFAGNDLKPVLQAKQSAALLARSQPALEEALEQLASAYAQQQPGGEHLALAATLGSLALAMLVLMVKVFNDDAALRREEAEQQRREAEAANAATQASIRRLMDEMTDLADGDLTVRATVTADLTGVIADSMNYAIEELSVLVRRINEAAQQLAASAKAVAQTSDELLAASDTQSDQIRGASGQVLSMAQSMREVSAKALDLAQAARNSLEVADNGAAAVSNSIAGMNDIRGQIQETSKRIKRLGESSQEIGEIVELISDITEQTNVLALNAAIQAAAAGEAGRGFSVVAEEVQHLAERSAEATKRIATLVRTIQADTHEAVAAMERSTQNVVGGARLSDATGQALAEISAATRELASLIEGISGDTQRQADVATRVAEAMKAILKITEQTTEGTQQTAVSLGEIAELANELRGSVAGFKV